MSNASDEKSEENDVLPMEELLEVSKTDPSIKMFLEGIREFFADEKNREAYIKEQEEMAAYEREMAEAEEEGCLQARYEQARALKAKKFAAEEIQELTGLSSEEIASL